jgi:FKBP-type peptidyl-prolyl cis-trans isomerase
MRWCLLLWGLGSACAAEAPAPAVTPAAPPEVADIEVASNAAPPEPEPTRAAPRDDEPELRLTASGLGIVEMTVGKGAEARPGQQVTVNYVGRLTDGREFDSTRARGPFEFELGASMVIPGWDEGIEGMRVGGVRKLIIPPALGYGAAGRPPQIPPNAVLEFEVELMEVR